MMRLFIVLALCLPTISLAQSDTADRARSALDALQSAMAQLEDADNARNRVRALTETITALEYGLDALRSGVRNAAVREAALQTQLQAQNAEIAALLGVLMQIGDRPTPIALIHPAGPTGTARAGMLLSELVPVANAKTRQLRSDLEELETLQALQDTAETDLADGLRAVQKARTQLNQAIANRTELPKRFTNDPVREAILIASAETLAEFSDGLDRIAVDVVAQAPENLDGEVGNLPMPASGQILTKAGEPDAAGVSRPGILLETAPRAIVTSPTSATVRYSGPLLDYGQVVILEPQADVLFVLAGLETLYATAGEVIEARAPLGLMGSLGHKNVAVSSTDGDEAGAGRSETLYIEVRQDNRPQDPTLWFRLDKDG